MKRLRQSSDRNENVSETDLRKVPPLHETEWTGDIAVTQDSEGCFDDEEMSLEHCELLSNHSDGWLC
ncbi:hypothetical protein BgiMline_005972 [Biomphalaria glabrata]